MRIPILIVGFCVICSSQLLADCGLCARQVTLSQKLANCYLQELENEREQAQKLNQDVRLVDLSRCSLSRSLNSMPQPKRASSDEVLDDAFMIPLAAMDCLAQELRQEDFDPENVKTFEIKADC